MAQHQSTENQLKFAPCLKMMDEGVVSGAETAITTHSGFGNPLRASKLRAHQKSC